MRLSDKTVVLGVTGSIAAYKAVDLASKLTQAGARVEVIMTESAIEFVSPLTFRNITGRQVVTSMWDPASEYSVEHVALAEAADIVVIAPATANIIAKLACGISDDMLTCTVLATEAAIVIAPAMNVNMYQNQVTQENIGKLGERGFIFVSPEFGRLASGKMGMGRFASVGETLAAVYKVLGKNGDLSGKRIVVTAGGTQEAIDPVRCLTNCSSGKMGYALAEAARDRGAEVILITAPCAISVPYGIEVSNVVTADDMFKVVKKETRKADVLIMAAAVADYRPTKISANKIKREKVSSFTLELERTPDILGQVKGSFMRVGFAAETENLVANAKKKLKDKQLDLIIANDITIPDCGIGADDNKVVIIESDGTADELPMLPKREVADRILDKVVGIQTKKH